MVHQSAQEESFAEEYRLLKKGKGISSSSKLICLQPPMDDYGIMRSNSRTVNAEFLPIKTRYPVILPQTSWVTKISLSNIMKMVITVLVQTMHLQFYHQSIGSCQHEKSSEMLNRIMWYVEGKQS